MIMALGLGAVRGPGDDEEVSSVEASDRAIALPDGASLLHIGMPKSGTSALQSALHVARGELEEHGVDNVSRDRHEMMVSLTASGTLPKYRGDLWQARWEELARDFRNSTARHPIWSSETLSQAPAERIKYIAEKLGRDDVHVVLTLRPLTPMMTSQWQQSLRVQGTDSLEDWLRQRFDEVSPDGQVNVKWKRAMPYLHRRSLRRVVEEWGAVFGEDRLVFTVAPPGDREFNRRCFEQLLEVPDQTLAVSRVDNASLPFPEAEMLRHFNRAYSEQDGDHKTWMETVGTQGKRALNRLTGLQPAPIPTPRWVAHLANEHTAGWIRAVEQSGARVIGDLNDLIVDPETFPEQIDVPESVSVDSAGRLAEIFFRSAIEFDGEPQGRARTTRTRDSAKQTAETPEPSNFSIDEVPASELVTELRRRVRRRLARRVRGR